MMTIRIFCRILTFKSRDRRLINKCTKLGNVCRGLRTHTSCLQRQSASVTDRREDATNQKTSPRPALSTNLMFNSSIVRYITFICTNENKSNISQNLPSQCQGLHDHTTVSTRKVKYQKPKETTLFNRQKLKDKLSKKHRFGVKGFKENIATIPNILTLSRIASAPVIGYLTLNGDFTWALGLFICAGITDVLDGVIARNMKNQTSVLGTVLDPLADKVLVMTLFITLTATNLIPVPLTALIVSRDFGLIAASFYIRYISLPSPKTLSRYFDVTHATAELYPSAISKVNTALQLSLVALSLAAPVFGFINHPYLQALWYTTAATTFASGLGYVLNAKSSVKILTGLQQK